MKIPILLTALLALLAGCANDKNIQNKPKPLLADTTHHAPKYRSVRLESTEFYDTTWTIQEIGIMNGKAYLFKIGEVHKRIQEDSIFVYDPPGCLISVYQRTWDCYPNQEIIKKIPLDFKENP